MEQIKQHSPCKTFFGDSAIEKLRANAQFENAEKTILITVSCALIGHMRNNVGDFIGAKTTKERNVVRMCAAVCGEERCVTRLKTAARETR